MPFMSGNAGILGTILPNLTHELKTPLHSILTLAQLLLTEADGPLSEEQKKQISMIVRNGDLLLELITDLLQYSSLESRTRSLVVEEFSPEALFDAVCDAIQPLAEKNQVILEREYRSLPETFVSDRTLLRQIAHNLVANAVKFTPAGGVVYLFGDAAPDGGLSIEVVDSGIGIPPEVQKRIFEEFYQAESGEARRFGGVGLGLSLVRSASAALKGKIELRSEDGQGSLFKVVLPTLESELKKPRVLIVETDPVLRLIFEQLFRSNRFECKIVINRTEVLELLTTWHPGLILLDVPIENSLPDYSLLQELRSHAASAQLPIILVSALDGPKERASGFQSGASDYLVKPFDNAELLARVRSSLRL